MKNVYDVVIIGGGPNGLICAAYLSRAGLSVAVLEARHETGGGLATEEFAGFRFNLHATYQLMSEIMPPYRDFNLKEYGVKFIYPDVQSAYLAKGKRPLIFYRDTAKTSQYLSTFSKEDGKSYLKMYEDFKQMSEKVLIPLTYVSAMPPVDQVQALQNAKDDAGKRVAEISEMTPLEILDAYKFKDPVRSALLNFIAMWGISPEESIGYLFPLYVYRMTNASLCAGGSHRLSSALHKTIIESGGEIYDRAEVVKIIQDNNRVQGVVLEDGKEIKAKIVVSTVDPQQTFLRFFNENEISTDLQESAKNWEWEKQTFFGMHLGLREMPHYVMDGNTGISADIGHDVDHALICFIGIHDTDELLSHVKDIEQGKLSQILYGHATCPSIFDPIQAPKGFHTGRWESLVPYNNDWDRVKDDYANKCLSLWKSYAPNIEPVHTYVYPPTYIEKKLKDMVRGSFKQGAYTPLQMGYFRPNESCSQIRTPVDGLYVCGASVYPGGMIIAGPGYVGANIIAQDMGVKKNWEEPEFIKHAREARLIE